VDLIGRFGMATDGHWGYRAHYLPDAIRVCLAGDALALADNLQVDEDRVMTTRGRYCLLTAQALTAEAKGDLRMARDRYEEAARRWEEYGFRLERGHALLGTARCRLGMGEEAAPLLAEARQVFAALGARPLVTEADGWLSQTSAMQA
jgi:hypothetical protein